MKVLEALVYIALIAVMVALIAFLVKTMIDNRRDRKGGAQ